MQPYFPMNVENHRKHGIERWREFVMERDGYRCVDCSTDTDLTVDHIIPVWAGGRGFPENFQVRCGMCQKRKARRDYPEHLYRVTIPGFGGKLVNRRGCLLDVQLRRVPLIPLGETVLLTSADGHWSWSTFEGFSQTALRDPWVTFGLRYLIGTIAEHPAAGKFWHGATA